MTDDPFIKHCEICGAEFEHFDGRRRCCDKCRNEKHKKSTPKIKKPAKLSIAEEKTGHFTFPLEKWSRWIAKGCIDEKEV